MKIAFLAYEYPPCIFGGVGFFSKEFAEALSHNGVELTVVSSGSSNGATSENVHRNLRVVRIPTMNFPPRHFWWQFRNCNLIVKLLDRISPDVVHANSVLASLPLETAKRRLGIPNIVTIHGDYNRILRIALKHSRLMLPYDFLTYVVSEPLHERLLQTEMKAIDCAVAVSKHVKLDISKRFRSTRITNIYNGLDIKSVLSYNSKFEIPYEQHIKANPRAKVRLAYVGRLYWIKGVTYLLKAFTRLVRNYGLSNVELHVYGDGPLRPKVLKYVKLYANAESRVLYHGVLDRISIFKEMQLNDIIIFPSLYEACPMALIEALALGKPVVVSDMPWSEEFIAHGINGVRTNTLDPEAFATTLSELCENKELRDKISGNASEDAQKYSIVNTVSMYKEIYSSLLH